MGNMTVIGRFGYGGGICGYISTNNASIKNSYSIGSVVSKVVSGALIGGILGANGSEAGPVLGEITNCY